MQQTLPPLDTSAHTMGRVIVSVVYRESVVASSAGNATDAHASNTSNVDNNSAAALTSSGVFPIWIIGVIVVGARKCVCSDRVVQGVGALCLIVIALVVLLRVRAKRGNPEQASDGAHSPAFTSMRDDASA
jgi:hypothetical protein